MDFSSTLTALEAAVTAFPVELRVEAEISLKVHDDVPAGYVEDASPLTGTFYRKVLDAQSGIVTKSVRFYIPD